MYVCPVDVHKFPYGLMQYIFCVSFQGSQIFLNVLHEKLLWGDVHGLHSCSKVLFDLLPDFSSGLIKAALGLRNGQMKPFRDAVRAAIRKKLRIYTGYPDDEATCRRRFLMDLFFPEVHRVALSYLVNGELGPHELQHFCNGCCKSKEHCVLKMEDRKSVV